jgi:soluble lytic murein transglycosylase-like protein
MYGHEDDDTGELPRFEPQQPWTFDQRPDNEPRRPYQSAAPQDGTTAAFAVPSSRHRASARYAGEYLPMDREAYRPARGGTAWWRSRGAIAVGLSVLAVLLLGTAGFALLRSDDPTPVVADAGPTTSATESVAPSATPTPTPSATPSPKPTPKITRTQAVVPIPTQKPPPAELPPPPPPPVPDSSGCVQHPGPDAPAAEVRTALAAAGAREYWKGVQPPSGLVGPTPVITIPANLMNAVAWTESSWRSTVIACDKGIGLMQVMPDTATWMNQRFDRNYDVHSVDGNAALGAMYLEWLTMYFGLYYFGSFNLNAEEAVGDGGAVLRLGDVVIAAYNFGHAGLEHENDVDKPEDDTLWIPNQWYVDRVYGYVANCPCDSM